MIEIFDKRGFTRLLELDATTLVGADLSNRNLSDGNFIEMDLRHARFQNSTLENADFRLANLEGADFTNANLRGSDFTGANLTNAKFDKPTLGEAAPPHDRIDQAPHTDPATTVKISVETLVNKTPDNTNQ